jgi:hypothetical protein
MTETEGQLGAQEVRNERALFVYSRVQHKLTGKLSTIVYLNWHHSDCLIL